MANDLGSYVVVLVLGIGAALVVGQVLLRTGQAVLEQAFGDQRVAHSVNGLLAVLFHLGALGVLALISTVDVPVTGTVQTVVTKLGVVLLILGAAHGLLLLMLTRIRARSREQAVPNPPAVQPPIVGIGSSLPR